MTELNKALVFQDGKVQRVGDDTRLTIGAGIEPAEAAGGKPASIAVGAGLEFDLNAQNIPQHQIKNAELLLNRLSAAPSKLENYGKFYALADTAATATSTSKLFFLDDTGTSHFLQNDGLSTITEPENGSLYIDFDPALPVMRTVILTKATDFASTAASLKPGRAVSLHIKNNSAEEIEVTFPLNGDAQRWTWLGGTTPTVIPAGQESILSLVSLGTSEDSVLAAFSYNDSEQITGSGTPDYLAVFENQRDIRSAFLYLYEEDANSDDVADYTRLGVGSVFGPQFQEDGVTETGLRPPATSLHIYSNKEGAAEAIAKFESSDAAFKMFALNASPEGVVTGSLGDIASDSTNGSLYFKSFDDGDNTGWQQLATATRFFTVNGGSALAVGESCYFVDGANDIVDQASAIAQAAPYKKARFAGIVVAIVNGKAEVRMSGVYEGASFAGGLTLRAGDPVFLSTTSGKLTNDVSGFSTGQIVAEVGVISNVTSNSLADVVIQPKNIVVL